MFNIIRLVIGCAFLGFSIAAIHKLNAIHKRRWYTVFTCVTVAMITVLEFLPFENLFITFESPQKVYDYYRFGGSRIELVVEGKDCDFVVDRNKDAYTYLIIPKTADGWKNGIGSNTKRIEYTISNGVTVAVYQYRDTDDYFLTVLDTNGGETVISDDYGTEFFSLETRNDLLRKTFVTYYAHIPEFYPQYTISINGNNVTL